MHKSCNQAYYLVIKRHLNLYDGRYKVHIYSKPAPTTMLTLSPFRYDFKSTRKDFKTVSSAIKVIINIF
jgi:hypothetical protein